MKISYKVLFAAVLASAGTNAFAADVSGLATTNYVKGAIGSLSDVAHTGSYDDLSDTPTLGTLAEKNAVTSADITDGTIVNADIADNAAIAVSKISGAQATANIVNPNADGEFAAGDANSTTKYPSMAAAKQIALAAATGISGDIAGLQQDVTGLASTVEANKAAAEDAIKALDGKGTGTTDGAGMVKIVTQTDGVVTATRGLVATADIDDGAVTGKKIASGAITGSGNINVSQGADGVFTVSGTYSLGAANGTTLGGVKTGGDMTATNGELTITDGKVTSAKIADDAITTGKIKGYDTGECSSTNCALVDLGAGAVWLPIVNEYNAGN